MVTPQVAQMPRYYLILDCRIVHYYTNVLKLVVKSSQ